MIINSFPDSGPLLRIYSDLPKSKKVAGPSRPNRKLQVGNRVILYLIPHAVKHEKKRIMNQNAGAEMSESI
jgi:hypothetical protein